MSNPFWCCSSLTLSTIIARPIGWTWSAKLIKLASTSFRSHIRIIMMWWRWTYLFKVLLNLDIYIFMCFNLIICRTYLFFLDQCLIWLDGVILRWLHRLISVRCCLSFYQWRLIRCAWFLRRPSLLILWFLLQIDIFWLYFNLLIWLMICNIYIELEAFELRKPLIHAISHIIIY